MQGQNIRAFGLSIYPASLDSAKRFGIELDEGRGPAMVDSDGCQTRRVRSSW